MHWKVHLFSAPHVVDIRAVDGNRIFVWSGIMDTVANDDELAATLAWEMGHSLAKHTRQTQFNVWSNIMFQAAEQATTIGLAMVSQGAVNLTGASGWMKWAYQEMRDMGPLDRQYNAQQEKEAAQIAVLIMTRSTYDPHALESFWARLKTDEPSNVSYDRIVRGLPPDERIAMLAELLVEVAATDTIPTVAGEHAKVKPSPEKTAIHLISSDSGKLILMKTPAP